LSFRFARGTLATTLIKGNVMKAIPGRRWMLGALLFVLMGLPHPAGAVPNQVLAWNNLGMHCMDSDYSVFSILPPYNTIEAQLLVNGLLVTSSNGYSVTYQAQADPDGSFNSTTAGKSNFYEYVGTLFGAPNLGPDAGLAGWSMPGPSNVPQAMLFEPTNYPAPGVAALVNWFRAEGIPLSPYDDALHRNPYPLMRLIAWNPAHQPVATNDIVLPISDEMDCRACHASGSGPAAQPAAGWSWDGLPERDYRLNILRLHDQHEFALHSALYQSALAARGFDAAGLYRSVTADGKPVLCAICHASEALGLASYSNTPPLTSSIHGFHAHVQDPELGMTLDNSANRAACYRCHPGSTTRCLRGAMGAAVAASGALEIQCQNCHGSMSQVGSPNRVGWFMEPACQSCHTGTATSNNGLIRYTSAFTDTNWTVRAAVNQTFATQPNTPATGLSLYRFSAGHGGLQCEACHGSTHAEFPSAHRNDNLRNIALQGHAGVMIECTACHTVMPDTANGGPHGIHDIGSGWVNGANGITKHADLIQSLPGGVAACQPCHGLDYRGTVLSRAHADRTLVAHFDLNSVTNQLFSGAEIGCYNCHNGPSNDSANTSAPPLVSNISTNTTNDRPIAFTLPAFGTNLTLRIIAQPTNGTIGLSGAVATYFPNPGTTGPDAFTFAAYNGAKNSNLGTGTLAVAQGSLGVGVRGSVPPSYPSLWPVPFAATAALTNTAATPAYDWNFGDGSPHGAGRYVQHTYATAGTYVWTLIASVPGGSAVDAGLVQVGPPVVLAIVPGQNTVTLSWPDSLVDTLLESSSAPGPATSWAWVTNPPTASQGQLSVTLPASRTRFFHLRRPW
jgi:hypothetical protein